MNERISASQAARTLPDLLKRVHDRGERFVILRNGRAVAELVPSASSQAAPTVGTLVEVLRRLPRPDQAFADNLEEIQARQPTPRDPWAS